MGGYGVGAMSGIVWQGASFNGQHIFRLINDAKTGWQLFQALIGTAATLSFKPVSTQALFLDAIAVLGTQYAMLSVKPGSIQRNTVPVAAAGSPASNGVQAVSTKTGATRGRVRKVTRTAAAQSG